MTQIEPHESEESSLRALTGLYEQLIARDTSLIQTVFLVTGAGITVATFLVFNLPRYSPFSTVGPFHNPWLFLAVPLLPTIFIGLLIFLTLHIQFLAQYGHAVEMRIGEISHDRLKERHLGVTSFSAEIPTFMRLSSMLFGSGAGRATRIYRVSALTTLLAVASAIVGISVYILVPLPLKINLSIVLIYLPTNLCAAAVLWRSLRPNRRLLSDALNAASPDTEVRSKNSNRTLLSYLIVPRVADHIAKIAIGIAGILIGDLAYHHFTHHPLVSRDMAQSLLLYIGVFEYLFYQARYSWNDVRGASNDDEHLYAHERKRIPPPFTRARLITVLVSGALKVATGVLIVLTIAPSWCRPSLLYGLVAITVSSLLYEAFRSQATWDGEHRFPRFATIGVFATVGSGYAIRITVGILLVDHGTISWVIVAVFALSMWAFEIATVSMAWLFEGVQFLPGWSQGTCASEFGAQLNSKSHLLFLLFESGFLSRNSTSVGFKPEENANSIDIHVLVTRRRWITTIWTTFGAVAFVTMCVASLWIAEGFNTRNIAAEIAVLLVSLVAATAWFRPEYTIFGAGIGVLSLAAIGGLESFPYAAFACVIVACFALFYNSTRCGNYRFIINWLPELGESIKEIGKRLLRVLRPSAVWLLGPKFFDPDKSELSAIKTAMRPTKNYVHREVPVAPQTESDTPNSCVGAENVIRPS